MKAVKLSLMADVTKIAEGLLLEQPSKEEAEKYREKVNKWEKDKKGDRPTFKYKSKPVQSLVSEVLATAIQSVHQQGDRKLLKRCDEIRGILEKAVDKGKKEVKFSPGDWNFVRNAFNKCDSWKNSPESAGVIEAVGELVDNAEECEIE